MCSGFSYVSLGVVLERLFAYPGKTYKWKVPLRSSSSALEAEAVREEIMHDNYRCTTRDSGIKHKFLQLVFSLIFKKRVFSSEFNVCTVAAMLQRLLRRDVSAMGGSLHSGKILAEEVSADRVRRRFEFGLVALGFLYCALYLCYKFLIDPLYNLAPFAAVFMMSVSHTTVLLLDIFVLKHAPLVASRLRALVMVTDGLFVALPHPSVQHKWVPTWLGMPTCASWQTIAACCVGDFRTDGAFCLQILCSYQVLLILRSGHSLFAVPACVALFSVLCVSLAQTGCVQRHDILASEHVTTFVSVLIPLLVNIGAKRMLERSDHRLYCMIRSQKQEIVNEKVLRCAAEFARDGLPAPSNAPPRHHSDHNAIAPNVLGQPIAPELQQTSGSVSSELDGFSSLALRDAQR